MGVGCAAATASAIGASLDIAACVVKWEKWFQRRLEEVRAAAFGAPPRSDEPRGASHDANDERFRLSKVFTTARKNKERLFYCNNTPSTRLHTTFRSRTLEMGCPCASVSRKRCTSVHRVAPPPSPYRRSSANPPVYAELVPDLELAPVVDQDVRLEHHHLQLPQRLGDVQQNPGPGEPRDVQRRDDPQLGGGLAPGRRCMICTLTGRSTFSLYRWHRYRRSRTSVHRPTNRSISHRCPPAPWPWSSSSTPRRVSLDDPTFRSPPRPRRPSPSRISTLA